ncbi:hypothetical protein MLD38_001714 [Melastoma candidum]|uniref:Uncharacterized protein n=1 Tax=Melastoma candidum TaxID=119954 RepID=A0ACB9SFE6_9MYRT|nr:hypothetical protein MLD38_001714 [Melastoma candidum]
MVLRVGHSTMWAPSHIQNHRFRGLDFPTKDVIPTDLVGEVRYARRRPRRMWKEVEKRESGKIPPFSFSSRVRSRRAASLQLSNAKDIVSPHKGSVNSLQVDSTEGRYLLSGASDASVAVFDAQKPQDYEGGGLMAKHRPVFVVDKQHPHGHKYAVSSATWYPIDTGLFVTGSYDHLIKVWDTNTTQAVMNFKMPGKVYSTSMSSLATSHMLIAAGTEDVQVRLCDVASGAFSHTLSGHRDGVMTVQWSTSSEWVLLTGGCDGAIRFWDIRRAGCFHVLDQSHSQLGRRPPFLELSAVAKVSTSRSSISGRNMSVKSSASLRKSVHGNGAKHLSSGKVPAKGMKQRLHPGMMSSQDRATAHYGAVTGLRASEDGMYLFSAGSDSRLRLWDIESGCNTLVNFETVRLQASKPIQMSLAQESALVFIPCMTAVKGFDWWTGKTCHTFRGHYEYVNCCWYSSQDQELYTGGNDRQILVWMKMLLEMKILGATDISHMSSYFFKCQRVLVQHTGKYWVPYVSRFSCGIKDLCMNTYLTKESFEDQILQTSWEKAFGLMAVGL